MEMDMVGCYDCPILLPRALLAVFLAALPLVLWAWLGGYRTRLAVVASVLAAFAAAIGFFAVLSLLLNLHIDWRWTRNVANALYSQDSRIGDLSVLAVWGAVSALLVRAGRRRRRSRWEELGRGEPSQGIGR